MSDECDLEELTAFLEASDCEEETEEQACCVDNVEASVKSTKADKDIGESAKDCKKDDDDDECNLDEIEAFLQASDDEDNDDVDNVENYTVTTKESNEPSESKDDSTNIESKDAGEPAEGEDDATNTGNKDAAEQKLSDDEMEFEDFEEGDFEELESMMDSQSSETSQEKSANHSKPANNIEAQSGDDENEEVSGEVNRESASENGTDGEESDSESERTAHELIEAEMAAMAKRMKELKSLLKKKSSPDSCKKKSKSSPGSCKKSKSSSDSVEKKSKSHLDSERKSKSSPQSAKKHFKSSPDSSKNHSKSSTPCDKNTRISGKSSSQSAKKHSTTSLETSQNQSKSVTDCDKNLKSVGKSSADSLKKHIDKHKSFLDDKRKKSSSDRHFSDIASEKEQKTSPSRKVHGKETVKQIPESKQRSKNEQGDESNPFFTKTKDSTDLSQSRAPASFYKKAKEPVDSKTLFGDSDDSDWDDLAGEEKSKLSEEGKELKKLINTGHKKREAHTASYDPAVLKKPNMARWTETNAKPIRIHPIQQVSQKPALDPVTGTVSGKYKVKDEYMQRSTIAKEDERESVTDPFCGIRIINPRVPMDVFQKKMEGRNLVKISKLLSKMGTSDLLKENWVTLGVVVHKTEPRQSAAGKAYCIWKLSDLQNCDKTVTFFLFGNVYKEHWKNDLGVVIGLLNPSVMDKAEKNQAEIAITINHPQQLLMMGISKDMGRCRGTTKAGQPCSSFINKMQGEFCTYHVQSAYRKSSSKRTELQASTGVTPKAFTQQKNKNAGSGCFFYGGNTYTTQRPQATSSKDKMSLKKLQSFDARKPPGKITTMSLHDIEPHHEKKIDKLREKDKDLLKLLSVPSAGSMNFVKHLVKKDANPTVNKKEDGDEVLVPSASAKDLLKQHSKSLIQKKQQTELLSGTPTLGKGFGFGQDISLDAPIKKGKGCASAELAKQLAIAKIKSKGGLNKEDPNAVRKKVTSPEAREKIRKRVAEDMADDDDSIENSGSKEPPKKKSKLLGDLDLNSPEVQKLLKKKSKHQGALAEAEAEHEDRYFSALEKKEQMEDKMGAIMEVPVKLFMCLQCKYRYFSVHERCKKENHAIKVVKGVKRFFKCKGCKRRTVSIDRLPNKACKDCGESSWERVSMLKVGCCCSKRKINFSDLNLFLYCCQFIVNPYVIIMEEQGKAGLKEMGRSLSQKNCVCEEMNRNSLEAYKERLLLMVDTFQDQFNEETYRKQAVSTVDFDS